MLKNVLKFLFILKVACSIRVPVDVVKQRAQAQSHLTTYQVFKDVLRVDVTKNIKKFTLMDSIHSFLRKKLI